MSFRAEHKFDPARADRLDAPEREAYLPDAPLIDLLALRGEETVIEYGAGTGRLAIAVRAGLGAGGRVIAVEENDEMLARLNDRMAGAEVEAVGITDNQVPEPDGAADRVLAVNLLHEIRGERALEEMLRLLRPDGLLLVADWARGRELQRPLGPPDHILFSEDEAAAELERAGFDVQRHAGWRWHYVLVGRAPAPAAA